MKPEWKNAPDWAQWLAQDEDGEWWWYELEPKQACTDAWSEWEGLHRAAFVPRHNAEWKDTLEARP
jgi:hypothetical protein